MFAQPTKISSKQKQNTGFEGSNFFRWRLWFLFLQFKKKQSDILFNIWPITENITHFFNIHFIFCCTFSNTVVKMTDLIWHKVIKYLQKLIYPPPLKTKEKRNNSLSSFVSFRFIKPAFFTSVNFQQGVCYREIKPLAIFKCRKLHLTTLPVLLAP